MKRRRKRRSKKAPDKTMDLILLLMAVFLVAFIVTMIVVFVVVGSEPSTLIACVFTACTAEGGFMAQQADLLRSFRVQRYWYVSSPRSFLRPVCFGRMGASR